MFDFFLRILLRTNFNARTCASRSRMRTSELFIILSVRVNVRPNSLRDDSVVNCSAS
jgi:hypothetical protein